MSEVRVALVDDHQMVRNGLTAMLDSFPDYDVVMQASNGKELIEKLELLKLPDVMIIDIHMPIMNGYETIAYLQEKHPDLPCLALTFDDSDDALVKSIRAGARGFLLKDAGPDEIFKALESIRLTGYFHNTASHSVMTSDDGLITSEEKHRKELLQQMSDRELEFLRLVCSDEELTYEQIAQRMSVHRRTVDNYRMALFSKFDIKSKAGLVLFAVRCGLIGNGGNDQGIGM